MVRRGWHEKPPVSTYLPQQDAEGIHVTLLGEGLVIQQLRRHVCRRASRSMLRVDQTEVTQLHSTVFLADKQVVALEVAGATHKTSQARDTG